MSIASEWVLTAAHCLFFEGEESLPSAVVVGREDFTIDDQGNYNVPEDGERVEVADVEIYPFFDLDRYNTWDGFIMDDEGTTELPPRSLGYADIALIKLASPVQSVTDFAILPTSYRVPVGATSTVFGWGLLAEDGPFADQLNFVNLPIVSNFTCSRAFGAPGLITFDLICAGPEEGGQDACGGDSGGPLVVVSEGRPEVVGIVNTGRGCARPGLYGVYTRVFPFIRWIDSVIEGEDTAARTEFSVEELSRTFSTR
ncbi:MAG: serine protease [Synechococcaceae cyanobacterium SM2_3_1]|nr:serine protease [Synechococcaceae cyanobacterium SM2_3_1]